MGLKFDDIVSVAGKSGLYKILKPTKNGYIVEELQDQRQKLALGPNHRVSMLKEISIYTTDGEGSIPLIEVYQKVKAKFSEKLPVESKDDTDKLFSFLKEIVPNYDSEKVYHSDVKKLVSWYNFILKEDKNISFIEEKESKDSKDDLAKAGKSTKAKKKPSTTKIKANKPIKGNTKPQSIPRKAS